MRACRRPDGIRCNRCLKCDPSGADGQHNTDGQNERSNKAQFENTYEPEEIDTVLNDLAELTEAGQLFAPDTHEACIQDVMKRKTVVKALCLHIAHDCNLACKYCFAEEGEYHGRRALMSFEVGKKALDFLIANSGSRNLEVDLAASL